MAENGKTNQPIPLDRAYLCLQCLHITGEPHGFCPRCERHDTTIRLLPLLGTTTRVRQNMAKVSAGVRI